MSGVEEAVPLNPQQHFRLRKTKAAPDCVKIAR